MKKNYALAEHKRGLQMQIEEKRKVRDIQKTQIEEDLYQLR